MTDTGSMEPIPEAVTWALRADAWSQRPTSTVEQSGTMDVPAGRWSEVATTGRPAFPPDGVGWRSATSEWRSSSESRWRQTTEWRSSTGTSGWRSTTEAWQTGGNSDDVRPPVEPLTRLPAISGTAWPTPANEDQPWSATPGAAAGATDTWQQPDQKPSWQAPPAEPAPPWQTAADPTRATTSWQSPAESTPSWRAAADTTPSWRTPVEETPSWRAPADTTPSWRTPADTTSSWRTPVEETPSWRKPAETTPTWQTPSEPGPSWRAPADDTPSWRQPADTGPPRAVPDDRPRRQGAADESAPWRSSPAATTSSSWQTPAAPVSSSWQTPAAPVSSSWQTPAAPTSSSWQTPAAPTSSSWQTPAGPVSSRRTRDDAAPPWQQPAVEPRADDGRAVNGRAGTARPWPVEPASGPYSGGWSGPATYDDGRHLVREDDRALWRREAAAGMRGTDERSRVGRRRAPDGDGERPGGGTGWAARGDADDWAGHTDTSTMPAYRDDDTGTGGTWRGGRASTAGRPTPGSPTSGSPGSGSPTSGAATTGGWRERGSAEETRRIPYGSGTRGGRPLDDEVGGSRRRRIEGRSSDDPGRDGDTGSRRRKAPATDPWARDAADTSVGPLAWQAPEDTGSWQSPSDTATWRRYVDDPEDEAVGTVRPRSAAASWQDGPERRSRRRVEPDDDDEPRGRAATDDLPRRRAEPESPPRRGVDPDGPTRRRARSGPDTWQEPAADPGVQQDDEPPPPPPWRPGQDDDRTQTWRRELQDDLRRGGDGPGRADATEIRALPEPGSWRLEQGDQPARGTASYRDGSSDDWRQQLASQGDGGGAGGSGAAGASDFPKFRPSDSAVLDLGDAPASPRARGSAAVESVQARPRGSAAVESVEARPREELLVGTGTRGGGGRSWQEPPDTQWPPRRAVEAGETQRASAAVAGPYERRPVGALMDQSARQRSLLEPDEDLEDDPGGPAAAVGFTVAWYSVPVVLFVIYMLVLDGAQQAQALQTLAGAAPRFGLSLILSMVVAVGLRWASGTWKAASVGLAAAVMGGGLATVLNSAITGQSLS